MPPSAKNTVTILLEELGSGDELALEKLLPLVYDQLRVVARNHLRKARPSHTLQPTALVHEVFLKLSAKKGVALKNRAHFFAVASRMMRQILVDYARRQGRKKRGGGALRVSFDEALHWTPQEGTELLQLDRVLQELARVDARRAKVVELRYFGGLSLEETAEVIGASVATVKRDFALARAWLYRELTATKE